ncbi:MAG TPA: DUF5722 domain-containing protein [Candidatus Saccharimonadales bacterium]|nr:DUF5722 domain-containing protein [Candidatus Saccharimonadales bacterium]
MSISITEKNQFVGRCSFSLKNNLLALATLLVISGETAMLAAGLDITATRSNLQIRVSAIPAPLSIVELTPDRHLRELGTAPALAKIGAGGPQTVVLPRFDQGRDRIYSAFAAVQRDVVEGSSLRHVTHFQNVAAQNEGFPPALSKKGLQVQMVDDAIALGVKHAALNVNLATLVDLKGNTNNPFLEMDGRTYYFHRRAVEGIPVKKLNDAGMVVTFILLNYANSDPQIRRVMTHPDYDTACSGKISAFNLTNPESLGWYEAALEFLANRFSSSSSPHGRVANYIIGNEVNSHFEWYNLGKAPVEKVVQEYEKAVRVANTAVRKYSPSSRVYLSLEHHWNMAYTRDALKHCPGKRFLEYFNQIATEQGNYDWNLAFHPYPENLFNPRTWRDKTALPTQDSPRITFKNLDQLTSWFQQPENLYEAKPRHIILSEQGFHSSDKPDGELYQAAGYCYAWYKVQHLSGIDSFILHRHVDNKGEGGLNLGLWTRKSESGATPDKKKKIYEVFRAADTPGWEPAFEFAKPVIGISNWNQILQ